MTENSGAACADHEEREAKLRGNHWDDREKEYDLGG